jgi:hypothetical protein
MMIGVDLDDVWTPERTWWAGSDEWGPWTERPAIRVLGTLPTSDFATLLRVETVADWPEQFLFGVSGLVDPSEPGARVPVMVFGPEVVGSWDGRRPLRRRDLRYRGEAVVSARAEDVPGVGAEERERRRKGWWW